MVRAGEEAREFTQDHNELLSVSDTDTGVDAEPRVQMRNYRRIAFGLLVLATLPGTLTYLASAGHLTPLIGASKDASDDPVAQLATLKPVAWPLTEQYNEKSLETGMCVIDVYQAFIKLTQAGLYADAAAHPTCKQRKESKQMDTLCASTVSGNFAFVGYGVQFIAGAASQCSKTMGINMSHVIANSDCAANIAGLLASISQLVNAATGVEASCDMARNQDEREDAQQGETDIWEHERDHMREKNKQQEREARARMNRLERIRAEQNPEGAAHDLEKQKKLRDTMCAMSVNEFLLFFARAGMAIDVATQECSKGNLDDDYDKHGEQHHGCAANILGIAEALTYAANSISNVATNCPQFIDAKAACAADIINLVASTAGIAAQSTNMKNACTLEKLHAMGTSVVANLGAANPLAQGYDGGVNPNQVQ